MRVRVRFLWLSLAMLLLAGCAARRHASSIVPSICEIWPSFPGCDDGSTAGGGGSGAGH